MEEWCSSTGGDTSVSKQVCITTTADTTTTTSTTTTTTTSPPSSSPSPCSNFSTTATMTKKYRGVRMRKWGKWVAEIREPNKRSRIWLGSYSSPVAAARAYDTAMFCLRGRAARLNFPDQLRPEDVHCDRTSASIRTKAIEVGTRVDAAESSSSAADHHQHKTVVYSSSSTYKPDLNLEPNDDDDDNGFP